MSPAISTLEELKLLARQYRISFESEQLLDIHRPLLICGITAAGKNAVMNIMMRDGNYAHVVSHTTRPPRTKELNGVDHWFISEGVMTQHIKQQDFIEVQLIHGDYCYGTSTAAFKRVVATKKRPVMDLNIEGIETVTRAVPSLQPLFILPPDYETWMQRLGGRDQMSDGEKERRLHSAKLELEAVLRSRSFIYVVNKDAVSTADHIMRGWGFSGQEQYEARKIAEGILDYLLTL